MNQIDKMEEIYETIKVLIKIDEDDKLTEFGFYCVLMTKSQI